VGYFGRAGPPEFKSIFHRINRGIKDSPQINRQDSWKIGKDGAGKQQGKFKPMESTPV